MFFHLDFVTPYIYDICSTRARSSLDIASSYQATSKLIAAAAHPPQWVSFGEVSGVLVYLPLKDEETGLGSAVCLHTLMLSSSKPSSADGRGMRNVPE